MNWRMLIIMIIILALAGLGAWFYYFQAGSAEVQATPPAESSIADIQAIEQELADLRRLKTLQLDTSVLKDPFLQSLQTPQTFIPNSPFATATPLLRTITPGRPNPFIPF